MISYLLFIKFRQAKRRSNSGRNPKKGVHNVKSVLRLGTVWLTQFRIKNSLPPRLYVHHFGISSFQYFTKFCQIFQRPPLDAVPLDPRAFEYLHTFRHLRADFRISLDRSFYTCDRSSRWDPSTFEVLRKNGTTSILTVFCLIHVRKYSAVVMIFLRLLSYQINQRIGHF